MHKYIILLFSVMAYKTTIRHFLTEAPYYCLSNKTLQT